MAEEFKSIRENLFKALAGSKGERDGDAMDAGTARALIGAMFARAGKDKDEVVQTVAREIGVAVAAMIKEPLALLAKHQKLQISFEFVPKHGHEAQAEGRKSSPQPAPTPAPQAPAKKAPPTPRKTGERETED